MGSLHSMDRRILLRQLVQLLPPADWAILCAYYLLGMTLTDIVRLTGLTRGALIKRRQRALRRAQQLIGERQSN